jgi:putative hydrolase of the HAD superfamily
MAASYADMRICQDGRVPVLLFDLDDTLIVEDDAATAAFAATAATVPGVNAAALAAAVRLRARELWNANPAHPYCLRVGISSSEGLWCRFEGEGETSRALARWAPEYRREAWARALIDQGVEDPGLAAQLGERFGVERRARHELLPDAVAALNALGRTHRLALVTNGASCLQREKLRASGLEDRFEAIVVSEDLGVGKPDPLPFLAALEALAAEPADAWMIGDSLERDVEGALAAGLRAVWLNPEGRPGDHRPQVRRLAELPALWGATARRR